MDLEEIVAEATQLDEDSRASLASRMLESLTPPPHTISDEEVFERMRQADDNPDIMISHEEFVAGVQRGGD